MKSCYLPIFVSLPLAAACVRAHSGEFVSPKYGFKVVPPEGAGWAPAKTDFIKPPAFALEHRASGRRFMVIAQDRSPHDYDWDGAAIASLHAALNQALMAYKPVGRCITYKGLPAYECSGEFIALDGTTKGRARITGILTDKYIYFVSREKITDDPDTDKDLGAMWQSFAFTTPPQSPPPPPPQAAPESRMGTMLVVAAIGGLILIVVFARMFLLRRPGAEERRTKRMRYSYSEKAQAAAGASSPVGSPDDDEEFRRRRPPPPDLARQEKVFQKGLQAAALGKVGELISVTDTPNPADFSKRPRKKPLKIDRRFIKNAPEVSEEHGESTDGHEMDDTTATLAAYLPEWPSKAEMEGILRKAGLEIYIGRYSIRVEECSHFVFQEYGGDLGDPVIDADADSVEEMMRDGKLVSDVLAAAGVRHRFEIYDENDTIVGCLHHGCPPEVG